MFCVDEAPLDLLIDKSMGCLQLGHVFPRPGAPLTEQVIIDLAQNQEELVAANGDTYPLIFRLETVSEKGLTEGHVLEVASLFSTALSLSYHANMCAHTLCGTLHRSRVLCMQIPVCAVVSVGMTYGMSWLHAICSNTGGYLCLRSCCMGKTYYAKHLTFLHLYQPVMQSQSHPDCTEINLT